VKAHGEMIFGMIDDLRVKLRVQPFLCNPNDVGFGRTSDMRREKNKKTIVCGLWLVIRWK
jgi:hypothetical protein